ncbi:hypothetical protein THAOC_20209, partial [Thalassiosira oceanica]
MDVDKARTSPDDGSATGQSQRLASFEGASDEPSSLPPTTRGRNELFRKINRDYLENTGILLTAEKLCEKWNIAVDPPDDPTLILDIEGLHEMFGRLSEITDEEEVRALRKYAVRNMATLGVLEVRQQPRLCQLHDAIRVKCVEWDSSIDSSYDALAFTTFTQSIRDFEPLEATYYRLAQQLWGDDIERDEEEQECQAGRSHYIRDLEERIARLSRHIDEIEAATDEGTTNVGHPDDNSSQSLLHEVESDDPNKGSGTHDCAVSDDGQLSTPPLAQSSVSGDDGAHDIGMSWAEVDDDDDTSANDSGAANESATQPIS